MDRYSNKMKLGKQSGTATLLSDKIGFKRKLFRRDKTANFILIWGIISQEDINILIICAPNDGMRNFIFTKVLLTLKTKTDC